MYAISSMSKQWKRLTVFDSYFAKEHKKVQHYRVDVISQESTLPLLLGCPSPPFLHPVHLLVVLEAPILHLLLVDVHPCGCNSYPHPSWTSSSALAALAVDLRAPLVAMTEHVRVLPVAALPKSPRLTMPWILLFLHLWGNLKNDLHRNCSTCHNGFLSVEPCRHPSGTPWWDHKSSDCWPSHHLPCTSRSCCPCSRRSCSYLIRICVVFAASILIAVQVVCTSMLALGSRALAGKQAIVSRLAAIEELARMDLLCSGKTSTFTKNIITIES